MDAYLGVDVGTQSVKGRAIDGDGKLISEASTEYPLYIPRPGWTEQDPREMLEAAKMTISTISRDLKEKGYRIKALCFTGQMHTMILLDEAHKPLGMALLWNDGRAAREAEESAQILKRELGDNFLLDVICNDFLANWTGAHIVYVKKRHEEWKKGSRDVEDERWACVWEKAHTFLTPRDLIVLYLTGELSMDFCGGSETSLLDIPAKRWSQEAFRVLGIDKLIPPPLFEPGSVIGEVRREAAQEMGLEEGAMVVAGAGDCLAGALAGGVLDVGQMLFTLGTSGVAVAPIGDKPLVDPQLRTQVHFSTVPGKLVNMGTVNGAGIGLRFFRDVLGLEYKDLADSLSRKIPTDPYDLLTKRAAMAPPGSNGVMFSPYLTGDRILKSPQGRGAWYGISAYLLERESNGDANLIRAILEGVCFAVRDAIEIIKGLLPEEIPLSEIRMVGGGARSRFWVQLAADVFGQRVCTTTAEDASYGMALLAGVGAGAFSIEEAAGKIKVVQVYEPRAPLQAFYEKLYKEAYKGHYDRSQREIDEAILSCLSSREYKEAYEFWLKST